MTRAPFPYHGNKCSAASMIEALHGPIVNLVIPFGGALGELLGRSQPAKVETVNDADGLIVNVWRAIKYSPDAVAELCDEPVHEATLHAAHDKLVAEADSLIELLVSDPKAHDIELAAWWVWGRSAWLGSGWCQKPDKRRPQLSHKGNGVIADHSTHRKAPALQGRDTGKGVHRTRTHRKRPTLAGDRGRPHPGHGVIATMRKRPRLAGQGERPHYGLGVTRRQVPHLNGGGGKGVGYGQGINNTDHRAGLLERFAELAARLRHVRICYGDWMRVLTHAVTTSHGLTGVSLDPPYSHDLRSSRLYREDDPEISDAVREWARQHGDDPGLRITLAGKGEEHDELLAHGWARHEWRSDGEVIWSSPGCELQEQLSLLGNLENW